MNEEFEKVSVDISDEDQQLLVEMYVKKNLEPASMSAYVDSLRDGDPYEVALRMAIINEMCLKAFRKQLEIPFDPIP